MPNNKILINYLRDEIPVGEISAQDWSLLLEIAYSSNLIGILSYHIISNDHLSLLPESLSWQIRSAYKVYKTHVLDVLYEIALIKKALSTVGIIPTLLKGAAYTEQDLAVSKGRIYSDVDIYIGKEKIDLAEQILTWQGWSFGEVDEYDEKYYRDWMHELPVMVNRKTGVHLDVHHDLLPKTYRIEFNPAHKELECQFSNQSGVYTLSDTYQIIHSFTHLFSEGEFDNAYRDMFDLYYLFEGITDDEFYDRLIADSESLNVTRFLFYCVRYLQELFDYQFPNIFLQTLSKYEPRKSQMLIMDECYGRALLPQHPAFQDKFTGLAKSILFVRAHWLKMPVKILIPHLFHKAVIKPLQVRREQQLKEKMQ